MDELEEFEAAPGARSAQELRQHQDISAILIYTTFPSQSEAKKLGRALVESGLAACVNIFPQMLAIFSWEGKIEEADEAAMIVKTVRAREAKFSSKSSGCTLCGARALGSCRSAAAARTFCAGSPNSQGRKNDSTANYKEQFGAVPVNGCRLPQSWA